MALPTRNLFNRDDTLLGICEALGQDFGFNPLWLRLAFLPLLFVAPVYTIAGYCLMGLVVWASRSIFPAPNSSIEALSAAESSTTPVADSTRGTDQQQVPIAA